MTAARREFSAGGVIYKKTGHVPEVALIARNNKTVWCLPKGKIEPDEKAEKAAAREIREETGLAGRLIKPLGDITYWFVSPVDKARIFKKVRFFLFEYLNGSFEGHDDEVDDAGWFTIPEALKAMSYPSEKQIMQTAKTELSA